MNIDRLRYFAAVVETKNLRKAAELVGIAPASMSKAIATLENELGHELLRPDGRGIEITDKGLQIYRESSVLLNECKRFQQAIASEQPRDKKIRFATFEVFSSYFLSSFLKCNYPDTNFLLLEMTPGRIERAILDGVVDFGLTYIPSSDPSLDFIEVGSFKMGIFGKSLWADTEFKEWPFAVPTTELRIHSSEYEALDMWPRTAPKRLTKFEFELLETALQTSAQGLSVIHCPEFIVKIHNERVKSAFTLEQLKFPPGYGSPKLSKAFLVTKKSVPDRRMEQKLAKFMRSFK